MRLLLSPLYLLAGVSAVPDLSTVKAIKNTPAQIEEATEKCATTFDRYLDDFSIVRVVPFTNSRTVYYCTGRGVFNQEAICETIHLAGQTPTFCHQSPIPSFYFEIRRIVYLLGRNVITELTPNSRSKSYMKTSS